MQNWNYIRQMKRANANSENSHYVTLASFSAFLIKVRKLLLFSLSCDSVLLVYCVQRKLVTILLNIGIGI